jgi:type IX secretion system PorP/SprF family membrane protein
MKKILYLIAILFSCVCYSQQQPNFSNYTLNPSVINPGYATSNFVEKTIGLVGRSQWDKISGAPKSLSLFGHIPLNDKFETNFNITHDEVGGSLSQNLISGDLAYIVNLDKKSKLSFGLKIGANFLNYDNSRITLQQGTVLDDKAFDNFKNKVNPVLGFGIYYYTKNMFVGLSIPSILKTDNLYTDSNNLTVLNKSEINLMAGYVFDISTNFKIKPNVLVNYYDKNLYGNGLINFLLYDKFELGYLNKVNLSNNFLVGLQITKNLKFNFIYEIFNNKNSSLKNSSEISLQYSLFNNNQGSVSPRFF